MIPKGLTNVSPLFFYHKSTLILYNEISVTTGSGIQVITCFDIFLTPIIYKSILILVPIAYSCYLIISNGYLEAVLI
ncbi:hypothetical protein ABID22_001805 [Pontibacter aydingkolensis]